MCVVNALLLPHVAATLIMVGIIWFVQAVQYSLFGKVEVGVFAADETERE